MTTPKDFKSYHFSDTKHWQEGVSAGLVISDSEGLIPEHRMSPRYFQKTDLTESIHSLSIDPFGVTYWVSKDECLRWQSEDGHVQSDRFEASSGIIKSPRLIFGRQWVWGFDADTQVLLRYDAVTLQQNEVVVIGEDLATAEEIVDIASDGHDGIWVLTRSRSFTNKPPNSSTETRANTKLYLIDWRGVKYPPILISDSAGDPQKLVYLSESRRLAMLSRDGLAITLLDGLEQCIKKDLNQTVKLITVRFDHEVQGFTANYLDSDHRRRIILVGNMSMNGQIESTNTVMILDASASLIQRIDVSKIPNFTPFLSVICATARRDFMVMATNNGLFWFRFESAKEAQEPNGTFLTPALYSPDDEALRGWLRAEIKIDLPQGSALTVSVLSTDDMGVKKRVTDIAKRHTLPASVRQRLIIDELRVGGKITSYVYSISSDHSSKQISFYNKQSIDTSSYAVPLFDHTAKWLWLEIELTASPDSALPRLRDLRVIYPDISLSQYIPAIFRGDVTGRDSNTGDPSGFFRQLLGVLEATTQGLDEKIAALGQLIHPSTAQGEWLDFVARWVDLPWDDALPVPIKRRILSSAALILASRGTRACLERLISALLPNAAIRIVDINVEHGVVLLGNRKFPGSALPAVLTGLADSTSVLSRKCILGKARLKNEVSDVVGVESFTGYLRIDISASEEERNNVESMLESILFMVIPAGIHMRIRWLPETFGRAGQILNYNLVLDNPSPRHLGRDSHIGMVVLARGRHTQLTNAGLGVGFSLI